MHAFRRRDQTRGALEGSVRRERQPKRIEIVGLACGQASNVSHGRLAVLGRQRLRPDAVSAHGSHSRAKLNTFPAALNTIYRRLGRRRTVSWVLLFLGPPGNHTARTVPKPICGGRADDGPWSGTYLAKARRNWRKREEEETSSIRE